MINNSVININFIMSAPINVHNARKHSPFASKDSPKLLVWRNNPTTSTIPNKPLSLLPSILSTDLSNIMIYLSPKAKPTSTNFANNHKSKKIFNIRQPIITLITLEKTLIASTKTRSKDKLILANSKNKGQNWRFFKANFWIRRMKERKRLMIWRAKDNVLN